MRITRVDLDGFGCLRDLSAEMAPGLNVFYGLNEAGKSTLQQAVCAMLYGFYDSDRARVDEKERHERFRPWNGGHYIGSLSYEMDDGRGFEVRRDFSDADVPTQLLDLFTGEDVSATFARGRHGNIPFARRHLGMSRTVFRSCAFISQGEIFHVAHNGPKEIADAVAALADTAGRDVSATKAIARLKAALLKVGSDRARTADLPVARDKLASAEAEMAVIDESSRAVADRAVELERLQAELREVTEATRATEYAYMRARVRDLGNRLEEIGQTEAELEDALAVAARLKPYARFQADRRDELRSLQTRWERAADELANVRGELDGAATAISPSERTEFEALRTTVGSLDRPQVAQLQAIAYQTEPGSLVRITRAVVDAIRRAAAWAWRLVRRQPEPPAGTPHEAIDVSREEALHLLERHRRYLELIPAAERLKEAQRRSEAVEADETSARDRLVSLLREAGVYEDGDVAGSIERFVDACREREQYDKAIARSTEAKGRRDLLLGDWSADGMHQEMESHQRRLDEASIDPPDLSGASSRDLAREVESLRGRRGELEISTERLREEVRVTMSKHRSRAEVLEETAHWQRRVRELERAREALTIATEAIEEAMVSIYRDFAPAVNTFLSEGIEHVTDGRYTRAHVDPKTLKVSLLVPETGQVIMDPPVSHGTRTLAYVLMRIGLLQHMSTVGEPVPLILDDPFVDVDTERLPKMLEYLADLSDRIQILVFTKDEAIADWLRRREFEGRHRLHSLSTRLPTGAQL